MKKFYSLLLAGACVASVSAAPLAQSKIQMSKVGSFRGETVKAQMPENVKKSPAKAPQGTWKSIGEGTASEGLLSLYTSVAAGTQWGIEIEESETTPGWYRTVLYNENSPLMELVGEADTQYVYINATNPSQVYTEDFNILGLFDVYELCPESLVWSAVSSQPTPQYGTLKDGVIQFPYRSHVMTIPDAEEGSLYYTNSYETFAIALPGHDLPNYGDKPGYNLLGEAEFVDNIMSVYYDQQDVKSTVKVYQNKFNNSNYSITSPFTQYESVPGENLEINAAYPECCVLYQTNTGVMGECENPNKEGEWLECLTSILSRSANAQNAAAFMAQTPYDGTTQVSQTLTVPNSYFYVTLKNDVLTFGNMSIFYYYPDVDAEHIFSLNPEYCRESYIKFPENTGENGGVEDAIADSNANAPKEYFNLQGMRVSNPANGIYIVRQGNKVSKQYVK